MHPSYRWWILLPAGCGAAISILLFTMASDRKVWLELSRWFSFSIWPVYFDLSITQQHLQEAERGLDPLSDPSSEFAYPRAVLLLRYLGLQHFAPEVLGFLQGVVLTIGVVLVLRPFTPRRAIATSLLFFTPAILLGIERGNFDFTLFLLCAVLAWQWSRSRRPRTLAWPILAAIAGASLKLYPVFALVGGAAAESGRRRAYWLAGGALVAAYWWINRAELGLVMAKVPVGTSASWGCLVFFARLERYLGAAHGDRWWAYLPWRFIALLVYAGAVLAATMVGWRAARAFRSLRATRSEWALYWVGAAICCGCFIGANYAYRWVFALFTLPLILRNLRSATPTVAAWSRATVATMLLSLAAPLRSEGGLFAVVQLANWICVLFLVIGCVALRQGSAFEPDGWSARDARRRDDEEQALAPL